MSDQVSGRPDEKTAQARWDDKISALGSFAVLVVAVGVGFVMGRKSCPPCPWN